MQAIISWSLSVKWGNLRYGDYKMIKSGYVSWTYLYYQSFCKNRCQIYSFSVEFTAPRDNLSVWLTCNLPQCVSSSFSHTLNESVLSPRRAMYYYLLLLAIYHHSLTGWFISLGDNHAGCKSFICGSCLSFKFHTFLSLHRLNTQLSRDGRVFYTHTHTHTLVTHSIAIQRAFEKWFLPVSTGLRMGVISKITVGRQPQWQIWGNFHRHSDQMRIPVNVVSVLAFN